MFNCIDLFFLIFIFLTNVIGCYYNKSGKKWKKVVKNMLIGEYFSKINNKRRVSIPAKFQKELGNKVIITRGYDNCLIIVNLKQWKNLLRVFESKPFTNIFVRDTRRFLLAGANEIEFDSQNRFVISQSLAEFANLTNEIVFAGLVDWIEIWDKSAWQKKIKSVQLNAAEIAEKLGNDAE